MITRIQVRSVMGAIALVAFLVPAASGTIRRVELGSTCSGSGRVAHLLGGGGADDRGLIGLPDG